MAIAQRRSQAITTTVGGTFNLPNNTVAGTPTLIDGHTSSHNQNVYGATGPFTIKLGTGHVNNVYFTAGNQANTSVTGLAGNDSVYLRDGAYGTYTLNMGTGFNTVSLDDNFGKVIYTTTNAAATTYDTMDFSNTTGDLTASLVATSGAVTLAHTGGASTDSTIADIHNVHLINLGAGTSTITLNNLDDTVTFGNGDATITSSAGTASTYGDDTYKFKDFTGTTNSTITVNDIGGNNALDLSQTSSNVALTIGATSVTGTIMGSGAGVGHSQSLSITGVSGVGGYVNGIEGGTGNDVFTIGNSAGAHSINGGLGTNTLVYTGSQGVTLDVRDHEMANIPGTTDITFHGFHNYKLLGAGSNTFIGDGTSGNTIWAGNGNTVIDGGVGSAMTVHSDMGGNTTLILGDGYGASTVTNTAANGVLTVDASALTHSVTAALGVGNGTAKIDDGNGTSVTWDSHSAVTGYIGGDADTTLTGTGNYAFHITTGAGNDTITAAGTGNNVINTGDGTDSVSVGTGNNTVIFGSGSTGTLTATAGAGNNTVYAGGAGTGTENLGAASTGTDLVDYTNGGTHTLTMGTGDNTVQGFTSLNNWAIDVTNHGGALKGTLDLSNYAKADVTFDDHVLTAGKAVDLTLTVDANHSLVLHNFFDGSAATAAGSAAGTGVFDSIKFSDGTMHLTDVQALATAAGVWV